MHVCCSADWDVLQNNLALLIHILQTYICTHLFIVHSMQCINPVSSRKSHSIETEERASKWIWLFRTMVTLPNATLRQHNRSDQKKQPNEYSAHVSVWLTPILLTPTHATSVFSFSLIRNVLRYFLQFTLSKAYITAAHRSICEYNIWTVSTATSVFAYLFTHIHRFAFQFNEIVCSAFYFLFTTKVY